jgi:hypothetical protein
MPRLSLDDVLTVFGASEPIIRQAVREQELSEGSPRGLPGEAVPEAAGSSPSRWKWSKDKKQWINGP